jgi:hypothetical protein
MAALERAYGKPPEDKQETPREPADIDLDEW